MDCCNIIERENNIVHSRLNEQKLAVEAIVDNAVQQINNLISEINDG